MASIHMSDKDWSSAVSAMNFAEGQSMFLGGQRIIDKIQKQLDEQED